MGENGIRSADQSMMCKTIKLAIMKRIRGLSHETLADFRWPIKPLAFSLLLIGSQGEMAVAQPMEGDASAGQTKVAVCTACHGQNGNSVMPNWPKLAGQNAKYLFKQLNDIKSGLREVPEMAQIVSQLTEKDMADIAAYFSEQTTTLGAVSPELKPLGEALYRGGNASTGVPACMACHGPKGTGMPTAGFPSLSGQHAKYAEKQLTAFRAAARGDDKTQHPYRENDGDQMTMRGVAKGMTDDEIKAVSNYISGLH